MSQSSLLMPSAELLFRDGLGDRILSRDLYRKPLYETLLLHPQLTAVPAFEFALMQRVDHLRVFDGPVFVKLHQVSKHPGGLPRLAVFSSHVHGVRLSELLQKRDRATSHLSHASALYIIRRLLEGVIALHAQGATVSHGCIAPDRVLIAGSSVKLTDHVLGSALEQLRYSPDRYWTQLNVALPTMTGAPRFDKRTDVAQLGTVAVALFAGRMLRPEETIASLGECVGGLPILPALKGWLFRALQLDPQRAFDTALEASEGFEQAMSDAGVSPSPIGESLERHRPVPPGAKKVSSFGKAAAPPPAIVQASAQASQTTIAATGEVRHLSQRRGRSGRSSRLRSRLRTAIKLGVLFAALTAAFAAAQYLPPPGVAFQRNGTLTIESIPRGARVFIDRRPQGVTPATVVLTSGPHDIEVRAQGKSRSVSVELPPGRTLVEHVIVETTTPR